MCLENFSRIWKFNFYSFQKSFENVFSIPFFIQFLVSGAILCVTVFQIVMVKNLNFLSTVISPDNRQMFWFLDESST